MGLPQGEAKPQRHQSSQKRRKLCGVELRSGTHARSPASLGTGTARGQQELPSDARLRAAGTPSWGGGPPRGCGARGRCRAPQDGARALDALSSPRVLLSSGPAAEFAPKPSPCALGRAEKGRPNSELQQHRAWGRAARRGHGPSPGHRHSREGAGAHPQAGASPCPALLPSPGASSRQPRTQRPHCDKGTEARGALPSPAGSRDEPLP